MARMYLLPGQRLQHLVRRYGDGLVVPVPPSGVTRHLEVKGAVDAMSHPHFSPLTSLVVFPSFASASPTSGTRRTASSSATIVRPGGLRLARPGEHRELGLPIRVRPRPSPWGRSWRPAPVVRCGT
jgi:hypothetical protein